MKQQGLIFTPGPVKEFEEIYSQANQQTPYFRNQEFSDLVLDCEQKLLAFVNAPEQSRVVFLTASGTAGMEAAVLNLISPEQKALTVVSGGFGQRFVDICKIHQRNTSTFYPEKDNDLTSTEHLNTYQDHDALLINGHETSICHKFNLNSIGDFCQQHNMLHIVDGISMFLTDELDMSAQHIDALIISSQKGLAIAPGLAMVILTPKAIARLIPEPASLYFRFSDYLKDSERGQTPYTPAVSLLIQLQQRLQQIQQHGGVSASIAHAKSVATLFRQGIAKLPLALSSKYMANSVTALSPTQNHSAAKIVADIKQQYQIELCPNGGELTHTLFRVAHMGNISHDDTQILLDALHDYFNSERS